MESLIDDIEQCAPGQWTAEIEEARNKKRLARDHVLAEAAKVAMAAVRVCVRKRQPGLDALARGLAETLSAEAIE